MAKGRQPGVLAFGFKSFLEAVVRQKEGLAFDKEPNAAEKKKIDNKVSDLREALKTEKKAEIKVTGEAPHTKDLLNLFLTQLRETMVEVESTGSLREQLLNARAEREAMIAQMAELQAQLERATKKKTG